MIANPTTFADLFNIKVPNTHRKISVLDVCLMTECGLIAKFKYYLRQDIETKRSLLEYERLREDRVRQLEKQGELPTCKRCGNPLISELGIKPRPSVPAGRRCRQQK